MNGRSPDPPPGGSTASRLRSVGLQSLWAMLGAVLGILVNLAILAVSFREELERPATVDWRSLEQLVLMAIATALLLIVGVALAWRPGVRLRPLGIGLIVGAGIGMYVGLLWGMALSESPLPE